VSSWEVVAATGGALAVAASAVGIAAVASAIRAQKRTPLLLPEGPPASGDAGRIHREADRPEEAEELEVATRLRDIDTAGLAEQLGEIREASDAAAWLRGIDTAGLAEQLGEIREASDAAAWLRGINIAGLAQQLGEIGEASDAAARLRGIDTAGLAEQLGEIREASDAAARLRGINIAGLAQQLGEIREASEPPAPIATWLRGKRDLLSLSEIANELALAVATQWEAEAAVRRLNDPYPLPVSWTPADPSLTDSWDSLVRLASIGAGWPPLPPASTWAAGPDGLAGMGSDLVEVLTQVPTGRLVVLGEPGTGKTTLMIRLTLDLLARRADGDPVPILTSLASWNPAGQDLRDWLIAQLMIEHPALAAAPPSGLEGPTQAAALLDAGLILPILDGLDELPQGVRRLAISRINDALRPGQHLIVTSRSSEYRDAVEPREGVEVTLRGGAAVQLRPLDADAVRDYLSDDAGPDARARWAPVFAVLGTKAPVGQALTTPLMVGLARAIYNPRPGELIGALRNPTELRNPAALPTREAVSSLLLSAFIPAAYRADTGGRWTAQKAEQWLTFLARHLERIHTPDIAWWQLASAIPRSGLGLIGGFVGALIGCFTGALVGWTTSGVGGAIVGGLAAGLVLALSIGFSLQAGTYRSPARDTRWKPARGIPSGLLVGLAAGLGTGLAFGPAYGLAAGLTGALMFGTAIGLTRVAQDYSAAMSPLSVLRNDARTALVFGIIFGILGGLAAGLGAGLAVGLTAGLVGAISGFVFGMAAGFAVSGSAWPQWVLAHIWLALHDQLPWNFMAFLADAHRRGVLRQVGAVYQFRHIRLQNELAKRGAVQRSASR
jgi:NACHT domain